MEAREKGGGRRGLARRHRSRNDPRDLVELTSIDDDHRDGQALEVLVLSMAQRCLTASTGPAARAPTPAVTHERVVTAASGADNSRNSCTIPRGRARDPSGQRVEDP